MTIDLSSSVHGGMEAAISPMNRMPCCLYAGEWDPVFAEIKKASGLILRAKFFSLPGVSHVPIIYSPDLVLPRVIEFLGKPDR